MNIPIELTEELAEADFEQAKLEKRQISLERQLRKTQEKRTAANARVAKAKEAILSYVRAPDAG